MDTRLDTMMSTQNLLADLTVVASDALLDAAPQGSWSARTVMAHLRDHEYLCMRPALARALAEDLPDVHLIHDADWEAHRDPAPETRERLLADFALQRRTSLSILRGLHPAQWDRALRNDELGTFTIHRLVDIWIDHDAEHIAQIEELVGQTVQEVVGRNTEFPRDRVWPLGRSS